MSAEEADVSAMGHSGQAMEGWHNTGEGMCEKGDLLSVRWQPDGALDGPDCVGAGRRRDDTAG